MNIEELYEGGFTRLDKNLKRSVSGLFRIQNATFGPRDPDVDLQSLVDCRRVPAPCKDLVDRGSREDCSRQKLARSNGAPSAPSLLAQKLEYTGGIQHGNNFFTQ